MQEFTKKLILLVLSSTLALITAEFIMRFSGYQPYRAIEFQMHNIRMEPRPLFNPDTLLGYVLDSGVYRVYYPDSTYWQATHNGEGYRITSRNGIEEVRQSRKKIMILGDSFSYGTGLGDTENYPFLLQQELPDFEVLNYAVPGYGIANIYVQLKEVIHPDSGDIVIYAYLGEHDNRNKSASHKKLFPSRKVLENMRYVLLNENLETTYGKYQYKPFPFIHYSALLNFIEDRYLARFDNDTFSHRVARKALMAMNEYCIVNKCHFIFAGINRDDNTRNMLEFCRHQNIGYLDISVDLNDNRYNLMPYDDHPNFAANILFKDRLKAYLINRELIR